MDQIFEKFGLNLNLLIAQMINFSILFVVLYKLAYKPILKILDQRREKIEASLKQVKEIEERTQAMEQEINQKLASAKKQADGIIQEARDVGEKARNELLIRTNQEITGMLEKARTDIANEKENMMTDIRNYIVETSIQVVEKVLSDKLDEKTRERVVAESFKEIVKAS